MASAFTHEGKTEMPEVPDHSAHVLAHEGGERGRERGGDKNSTQSAAVARCYAICDLG